MCEDLTYAPIDAFPLHWRFVEDAEKYVILPEEDRLNFKPLAVASSQSLWNGWVRTILEALDRRTTPTIYESSEDDWEQRVCGKLQDRVEMPESETLYFFWEPTVAVETTWGLFLKYWSDFCYPSDVTNAAIAPKRPEALIYSEEKLWIVPRHDAPYTRDKIRQLGKDLWPWRGPYCSKCRAHIPQFADISPEVEKHLRSLRTMIAMRELRERTGCPIHWAKIWAFHPHGPQPSGPPCPYCGQPLRTDKAQQCLECGADWHGRVPKGD
jgi:hypothetical protein